MIQYFPRCELSYVIVEEVKNLNVGEILRGGIVQGTEKERFCGVKQANRPQNSKIILLQLRPISFINSKFWVGKIWQSIKKKYNGNNGHLIKR